MRYLWIILFFPWFPQSAFSEVELRSSDLDWEIIPAGYLEPKLKGNESLRELSMKYSDKSLATATNSPDSFAIAYVMLLTKHDLVMRIPASRSINSVTAEYGELRVRVNYTMRENGFVKDIQYPEPEKQIRRISRNSARIVDAIPIDKSMSLSERMLNEEVQGNVTVSGVRVATNSMTVRLTAIVDRTVQSSVIPIEHFQPVDSGLLVISNKEADANLVSEVLSDEKWIATHLLLSDRHYIRSQRVESTYSGYSVNANGLHADLTPDGKGGWVISYPSLSRDRAAIVDFWMMHQH